MRQTNTAWPARGTNETTSGRGGTRHWAWRGWVAALGLLASACALDMGEPAGAFVADSEMAFPGQTGVLEEGLLLLDEPVPIAYEVVQGLRIFEGDIVLDDGIVLPLDNGGEQTGQVQQALAVQAASQRRWPNATVPYVLGPTLTSDARKDAKHAMAHIASLTNVRFVARANQTDYVKWVDGTGCSSYVVRIGGAQAITLSKDCGFGSAVHEALHALGAFHEHVRPDRDSHVTVHFDNIENDKKHNFDKYVPSSGIELTNYDFGSIMHYGSYAFSKNGQPTILLASNGETFERNRSSLSPRDIIGLLKLYSDPIGEVGRRKVEQAGSSQWHTVSLKHNYQKPVVVVQPPTRAGGDPLTIRIRNVTSSSFQFQLDEWDYLDGAHVKETVHYLVMEAGRFRLPDGTLVEAGWTKRNHTWKRVSLNAAFPKTPTVLAQSMTRVGGDSVVTRLRNVSATGFGLRLQEQEASTGWHPTETVGYIAFQRHEDAGDDKFRVNRSANAVTHAWHTLNDASRVDNPYFLAQIQTFDGGDPAGLRYRVSSGKVQVMVEEEQSADSETAHTSEVVGWVAFASSGILHARRLD